MTTELEQDELTYLIQLVNKDIVTKQRADPDTPTPLEAELITKLLGARTDAIKASRLVSSAQARP
jgi:hypothetical protein